MIVISPIRSPSLDRVTARASLPVHSTEGSTNSQFYCKRAETLGSCIVQSVNVTSITQPLVVLDRSRRVSCRWREDPVELVERVQSMITDLGEQLQPMLADLRRRAGAILAAPKATWPAIAAEHTDPAGLARYYVVPLAAIPPLAKLIGWSLLSSHVGIGAGLAGALLSYLLSLASVAGLALVASKLAPLFEGEDNFGQAAKLVAYSATASWVGGIFRLVPVLGIVSLLASLYGCYLLYTGAPSVMSMPADRAPAYTAILVIATILIFVFTNLILAAAIGFDALGMV
jgi:hypothetical protein